MYLRLFPSILNSLADSYRQKKTTSEWGKKKKELDMKFRMILTESNSSLMPTTISQNKQPLFLYPVVTVALWLTCYTVTSLSKQRKMIP